MKAQIISKFLPLLVAVCLVGWISNNYRSDNKSNIPLKVHESFQSWKIHYHKSYSTPAEEMYRLGVYFTNYITIQMHTNPSYQLELNKFADLTVEEFESKYTGYKLNKHEEVISETEASLPTAYPTQWDWRTQGVLTPVQDQGQCNSSWAFAATTVFGAVAKISGFNLYQFSTQQLIDCSRLYKNTGCEGGDAVWAWEWTGSNSGLETEAQYPYKGVDQTCQGNKSLNQPPFP